MNQKLSFSLLTAIFIALIFVGISSLDSDLETLSKVRKAIVVNQVGYLPQWQKTALLVDNQNSTKIQLINFDTKKLVTTLTPERKIEDEVSNDEIYQIDFTSIAQPGKYYLQQDKLKSAPFEIGKDIYQQPLITLLRTYYLQRCGVELDDPVTGISHVPCHVKDGSIAHQDEFHRGEEYIPASGGWHNGAAYSKYVATTTVSIARLLNLYQQHPDLFPDRQLTIPESGNGVSDLLDEMKFGLDWLLKMQRNDGAVYRKLSGKKWAIAIAPGGDIQPRYLYGISTPETAKFAAVMAIASRTYQTIDSALATKYLNAAESAWQYLQTQPEIKVDWIKGDDSGSQKYLAFELDTEESSQTDLGDRLWAATELYLATGKLDFARYFAANLDRVEYTPFSWKNPVAMALIDYLFQDEQPTSEELIAKIKAQIQQQADSILAIVDRSPYNIANESFAENSNQMAAESGITLFYAYQLTQKDDYLTAATDQLDYILGRNHFDQTFVTGIGSKPVRHINHPFTIAKKIAIPGLVVGGSNSNTKDGFAVKNLGPLSYVDDDRSYATNQYAIDNNASLISLIIHLTTQN